jgi:peptidoglycan/LPS O-acetylase OafA/YrhL
VISGFLITLIVLADLRSVRFTFREFWARRIRRIFPPLIVMIGCTLLAAWMLTPTFDHPAIGRQALAALLSVANMDFWRTSGDYWGLQTEQLPLLHTWSLSVEEQFYLLFPLAIWIMYRWRPSWLTGALALLAATSFGLFLYCLQRSPTATFYLLPTRAWELAVGCALATVSPPHERGRSAAPACQSWLAIAGLAMILATYVLLPEMNGGVAATVLGAALVLAFAKPGPCRAILSLPPASTSERLPIRSISGTGRFWSSPGTRPRRAARSSSAACRASRPSSATNASRNPHGDGPVICRPSASAALPCSGCRSR